MTEVSVPDLGDFADVPVIEIHVAPGDVVSNEDPLVTLESDKATMDIPSPAAGTVRELRVKVGDLVSRGSPILSLDTEGAAVEPPPLTDQQEPPTLDAADPVAAAREPAARSIAEAPVPGATAGAGEVGAPAGASAAAGAGAGAEALADFDGVHASPGVRRLARELGLDLTALSGTGPKGRITKEDVIAGVRGPAAQAGVAGVSPRGCGDPGGAGAGLLEVRAGRGAAADPDPAAVRARAAPVLAQRPARHPRRRGRHHRPGRLPPRARHRGQGGGLPGHAARLPAEGQRLGAARVPQVQQLADAGEGRADLQGLLPPRRGRGHARWPGGAGDPRRRPQGRHGAQPGARRDLGPGA